MRICVLTYDFPHKKTMEVLGALYMSGYKVECVIAAPPVKLNIPQSKLRTKPRHINYLDTIKACGKLNIEYHVCKHNSIEAAQIIKSRDIDLAIIGGARILKGEILNSPRLGILNMHPGIIPDVRGIDALKWAIHYEKPIGVTAHLINEETDSGIIIKKEELTLYEDDTLIDISVRLEELEIKLMLEAIELLKTNNLENFCKSEGGVLNHHMPKELEALIESKLKQRLSEIESDKI